MPSTIAFIMVSGLKDTMKVSRKLIVIGAACVLGVAMAAGGASAATGR